MRPTKAFLLFFLTVLLSACHYEHPELSDNWAITNDQRDSLTFALTHHYSLNYNFSVTADSLSLLADIPADAVHALVTIDSVSVYHGDKLVVADVRSIPSDSTVIWVKVARDQETMGWLPENVLLQGVVPCDPISQFIHAFSNRHLFALYILAGIAALFYLWRRKRHQKMPMVIFNDINSFYPTLLCLLTAIAATLYGTIQKFVPDTWEEYYYHPTLNPFGQPFVLAAFLVFVWLILIVAIAMVDDVRRQLDRSAAITYLFSLMCMELVLYIFFSLTTPIYLGYVLLPVFCWIAVRRYMKRYTSRYVCGQCGQPLTHLGRCPHCGAINE
jgi:hypothetical protein